MRLKTLTCAVAAATAIAALAPTVAGASTEAQRKAWAKSQVTVRSHGTTHDNVCPGQARYRRDDGRFANAYGPNEGACGDIFTPFPVHREARIVVTTRPEVRELRIAAVESNQPLDLRDGRGCTELAPGRWECRMPPPGEEGTAYLRLVYPGALSTKFFTYRGHSPEIH